MRHLQVASDARSQQSLTAASLSYDYLFGVIEELGYELGWIGCEYRPPKAGTSEGLGWLKKRSDERMERAWG